MVTRSSSRKASESSSGELSEKKIPPWCSAELQTTYWVSVLLTIVGGPLQCNGRIHEKRKPQKLVRRIKLFYPLRENMWDNLDDDKSANFETPEGKRTKKLKTQIKHPKRRNSKLLICFLLTSGIIITYFTRDKIHEVDFLTIILPETKLISFLGIDTTSMGEECCHHMRHLTLALKRAEQALRKTHRARKTVLTSREFKSGSLDTKARIKGYVIEGARAFKGPNTVEWETQVKLWGFIPLWRVAPPADTVLSSRRPIPSDCWPVRGSRGELIIELPRTLKVDLISLEHIRPDTAYSAPKNFIVYGILINGTRMKIIDGMYQHEKAAKQYFPLHNANNLKKIVFTVLSNQGNPKYTCIYRIHPYSNM